MNEQSKRGGKKRRGFVFIRLVFRMGKAMLLFLKDKIYEDFELMLYHGRLFFGIILTGIGMLSFTSDRYCDGNTSSFYACTRPATYYYYPWWAILCTLLGTVFVTLWFLRKKKQH
jgi:hypothetical protein